jgi:uncharacterized protein (DUF433 family)
MPAVVDIGTLIDRSHTVRENRPKIAGTGVTVKRIANSYNQGESPEEIVADLPHLTLAQVMAALTYYFANKEEVDADIAADDAAVAKYFPDADRRH